MIQEIDGCRSCGSREVVKIFAFDALPIANALVSPGGQTQDQLYPLTLVQCQDCTLVQTVQTVPPDELFGRSYPYFSSYADDLVEHSRQHVENLLEQRHLGPQDLVLEIGSNDGYLLSHLRARGVGALGIDPAAEPVRAAADKGVETIEAFFSVDLSRHLADSGVVADVILANNVLAHVPDPNTLVAGAARLLAGNGIVEIEVPYVRCLVERREFDTIYHEHHCYFSATSIRALFASHGLILNDVEFFELHGGTIRCRFSYGGEPSMRAQEVLASEERLGMHVAGYYAQIPDGVEAVRVSLRKLLDSLREDGSTIAGYGAAAKGVVLMAATGVSRRDLRYVIDRNEHKHGRLMPGTRLPIRSPAVLDSDPPDLLLLLAWNHEPEIRRQLQGWTEQGGRFIQPIPEPRIV